MLVKGTLCNLPAAVLVLFLLTACSSAPHVKCWNDGGGWGGAGPECGVADSHFTCVTSSIVGVGCSKMAAEEMLKEIQAGNVPWPMSGQLQCNQFSYYFAKKNGCLEVLK